MTHTLGLYIPESNDCKVQKVIDMSVYIESFNVENGLLEVTPPGYNCPVIIYVGKNFNTILTVSNLQIAQSNSNSVNMTLPDGIYHYRYSIDPNAQIFVEQDELRVCKLQVKYRDSIRRLFNDRVKYGIELFNSKLKELSYVNQLIQAAIIMVQDGNEDKEQSLELYNEAYTLLKDYNDCATC